MHATATPDASRPPTRREGFGEHLRHWRQHRRLSQLALAQEAEVSTRHLSYVETGRAEPSREMVLRLADRLEVPLRERNVLLMAAGYAPLYRERPLDDPALAAARQAVELVLRGHEPFPALAVDRHWHMVAANRVLPRLLEGAQDTALLQGPVNVLRLSLHPQGLAPRIANLAQWRGHLFERLRQQIGATDDPVLAALLDELRGYPGGDASAAPDAGEHPGVVVPLRLYSAAGTLAFISTTTVFGSPVDVTLQELAVESFFPSDEHTANVLRQWAQAATA